MPYITYSCYAWRDDDAWQAICVDLDIAVQGNSFDDVYRCLNEAISDYIETVMELPAEDRDRLLNRRVPFWTRARIKAEYWYHAMRTLGNGGNSDHGSFPVNAVRA